MFTSKKWREFKENGEIYHQRTSQQSKKEKGKARKEQRKELSQHQKEQSREKNKGDMTSLPEWTSQ